MSKPLNRILATHPGENTPTLWELPDQGVYLTHKDSLTFIRICSIYEFLTNSNVLVNQGWILES